MKTRSKVFAVLVLFGFFCTLFFAFLSETEAARPIRSIEGANFNVSAPLNDNLKTFIGKMVYIHLRSGATYEGIIRAVGDHFVHLEKTDQRNFYDVLIRIDDISAFEAKFRDFQ